jgi:hypothetical protein
MILSTVLCAFLLQQVLTVSDADGVKPAASEQSVLAAYKRMEDADRKGDAEQWFALRDKKTLETMNAAVKDAIRKGGRARPAVKYEPLTVRIRSDRAVLLGRVTDPAAGTTQFQSVLFVVEDGTWKVSREQWGESAFDPFVLHGLLPPETGAFIRAGLPWKKVAYATINTEVLGKKDVMWKMQATFDESFVYIRYEWIAEIPSPGARIKPELAEAGKTGGPPAPPAMLIKATDAAGGTHSLTVSACDVVSAAAANHYTVNYSMSVKNAAGEDVFEYSLANDTTGHLLSVQDRYIDVRIPLGGLDVTEASKPAIRLEEAGSVLRILPYSAERFAGR